MRRCYRGCFTATGGVSLEARQESSEAKPQRPPIAGGAGATYFWVGGTDNWTTSSTRPWATTSGGAGGAGVPGVADTAIFDANSGSNATALITTAISVAAVTVNNATFTLFHEASSTVSGTVTLTAGSIFTSNFNCSWGALTSNTGNARTVSLGTSTMTITSGSWNLQDSGPAGSVNLNLDAASATITLTAASGGILGNQAYGTVNINGTGSPVVFSNLSSAGKTQPMTIQTLTRNATATADGLIIQATLSVGTFNCVGPSPAIRPLVKTASLGAVVAFNATTVNIGNVDFQDISAAGGGTWAGSFIGDAGGNAGITFTVAAPQAWQTTGSGNWSDATKWTSRVPLPQDDVTIARAFSGGSTITRDVARLGRSIDWTGTTGAPSWGGVTSGSMFGSLTLAASVTATVANVTFAGRVAATLRTNGSTTSGFTLNAPGGSLTFQDAVTTNSAVVLTTGTLSTGGQACNFNTFTLTGTTARTLNAAGTALTLSGTGSVLDATTITNLTITMPTSIAITNTTATVKTFKGGGLTFPTTTITGGGTGSVTISGDNTWAGVFTIGAPKTVIWTAGSTNTFNRNFVSMGSSGNLVTHRSSTAGTRATLALSGVGGVSMWWSSFQDIAGTGGGWWAQSSTNVSNNSGITFGQPSTVVVATPTTQVVQGRAITPLVRTKRVAQTSQAFSAPTFLRPKPVIAQASQARLVRAPQLVPVAEQFTAPGVGKIVAATLSLSSEGLGWGGTPWDPTIPWDPLMVWGRRWHIPLWDPTTPWDPLMPWGEFGLIGGQGSVATLGPASHTHFANANAAQLELASKARNVSRARERRAAQLTAAQRNAVVVKLLAQLAAQPSDAISGTLLALVRIAQQPQAESYALLHFLTVLAVQRIGAQEIRTPPYVGAWPGLVTTVEWPGVVGGG